MMNSIFFVCIFFLCVNCSSQNFIANDNEIRDTLNKTYHWIHNKCGNGECPKENTGQNQFDLYSGSSGVVVYLLQLFQFTQDSKALEFAEEIADNIIANYNDKIKNTFDNSFFHKGKAGIAFAFTELVKRTSKYKYVNFAQSLNSEVISNYGKKEMEIPILRWGSAGTGLYLIYLLRQGGVAVKETKDEILNNLNKGAKMMIDYAVPVDGDPDKLRWYYKGKSGYELPGYADGVLGCAYYLFELYKITKDVTYLNIARKGMNYAETIIDIKKETEIDDEACYIYHSNEAVHSDAKYYLGECNGNVGHIKAFLKAFEITRQKKWLDFAVKSGNGLLANVVGDKGKWWLPKDGQKYFYWDTHNLCDGTSGGIESLFLLNQFSPSPKIQKAIDSLVEIVYSKRIEADDQICWSQCESRKSQTHTKQVGIYQGASGISMTFMNMLNDEFRIKLPDYLF